MKNTLIGCLSVLTLSVLSIIIYAFVINPYKQCKYELYNVYSSSSVKILIDDDFDDKHIFYHMYLYNDLKDTAEYWPTFSCCLGINKKFAYDELSEIKRYICNTSSGIFCVDNRYDVAWDESKVYFKDIDSEIAEGWITRSEFNKLCDALMDYDYGNMRKRIVIIWLSVIGIVEFLVLVVLILKYRFRIFGHNDKCNHKN